MARQHLKSKLLLENSQTENELQSLWNNSRSKFFKRIDDVIAKYENLSSSAPLKEVDLESGKVYENGSLVSEGYLPKFGSSSILLNSNSNDDDKLSQIQEELMKEDDSDDTSGVIELGSEDEDDITNSSFSENLHGFLTEDPSKLSTSKGNEIKSSCSSMSSSGEKKPKNSAPDRCVQKSLFLELSSDESADCDVEDFNNRSPVFDHSVFDSKKVDLDDEETPFCDLSYKNFKTNGSYFPSTINHKRENLEISGDPSTEHFPEELDCTKEKRTSKLQCQSKKELNTSENSDSGKKTTSVHFRKKRVLDWMENNFNTSKRIKYDNAEGSTSNDTLVAGDNNNLQPIDNQSSEQTSFVDTNISNDKHNMSPNASNLNIIEASTLMTSPDKDFNALSSSQLNWDALKCHLSEMCRKEMLNATDFNSSENNQLSIQNQSLSSLKVFLPPVNIKMFHNSLNRLNEEFHKREKRKKFLSMFCKNSKD